MKSYCSSAQLHFMDTVLEKGYPPRRFDWRSVSRLTIAGCVTFQEVKLRTGEIGGKYVVLPEGIEQLRLAGWRSKTSLETRVSVKLETDYGLRDLPMEWLAHAITKHKSFAATMPSPLGSLAWLIANEWQRGLTKPAC